MSDIRDGNDVVITIHDRSSDKPPKQFIARSIASIGACNDKDRSRENKEHCSGRVVLPLRWTVGCGKTMQKLEHHVFSAPAQQALTHDKA